MRPETILAGLPRLVRIADEARWRSGAALGTATVVGAFWVAQWLLEQPVRPAATALAAAVVAAPTLGVASLVNRRRVRESLERAVPPPSASVRETQAATRERRLRLSSVVLTGIVILLLFDRLADQGGVMAGLLAGLLAAIGAIDRVEARRWEAAERERETRILAMVAPDALSPPLGPSRVYELPRAGRDDAVIRGARPFDLDV